MVLDFSLTIIHKYPSLTLYNTLISLSSHPSSHPFTKKNIVSLHSLSCFSLIQQQTMFKSTFSFDAEMNYWFISGSDISLKKIPNHPYT